VVGGPLLCRRPGCGEPARFAFKKARRALVPERCLDHKLPGMVEARHRVCEVVGCSARARFRLPGQKLTSRCAKHKEDGMLHSEMCDFPGCFTRASFRDGPGSKAKRCVEHCEEGMESIGKLCEKEGCSTRASYGYEEKGETCCKRHAEKGMVAHPYKRLGQRRW
jgi:hypothetical protein